MLRKKTQYRKYLKNTLKVKIKTFLKEKLGISIKYSRDDYYYTTDLITSTTIDAPIGILMYMDFVYHKPGLIKKNDPRRKH